MGGEGYSLARAARSNSARPQARSREKRARSEWPRRRPSEDSVSEGWRWCVEMYVCMDMTTRATHRVLIPCGQSVSERERRAGRPSRRTTTLATGKVAVASLVGHSTKTMNREIPKRFPRDSQEILKRFRIQRHDKSTNSVHVRCRCRCRRCRRCRCGRRCRCRCRCQDGSIKTDVPARRLQPREVLKFRRSERAAVSLDVIVLHGSSFHASSRKQRLARESQRDADFQNPRI